MMLHSTSSGHGTIVDFTSSLPPHKHRRLEMPSIYPFSQSLHQPRLVLVTGAAVAQHLNSFRLRALLAEQSMTESAPEPADDVAHRCDMLLRSLACFYAS